MPKIKSSSAYNHRDVVGLRRIPEWSTGDFFVHSNINKIFQTGFANRSADEFLHDAQRLELKWATDYICPTPRTMLYLLIARDMVVKYKLGEASLSRAAAQVFHEVTARHGVELDKLVSRLPARFEEELVSRTQVVENRTRELLQKQFAGRMVHSDKKVEGAARRIVLDKAQRSYTERKINKFLKKHIKEVTESLGIELKPSYLLSDVYDLSIMGAVGSGKSTLASKVLKDRIDNYAMVSTDRYRCFSIPFLDEINSGKNVFVHTQDMAFIIKEMVVRALTNMEKQGRRPNVLFDGDCLEIAERDIISKPKTRSLIAGYPGIKIGERVEVRAASNTRRGDQGRYINTTDLLKGHVRASKMLMDRVPQNVVTYVVNTNHHHPSINFMGEIDPMKKRVLVKDLKEFSGFLNKININIREYSNNCVI